MLVQKRDRKKLRCNLITNLTFFAALLKNVPMGCLNSVIQKPFLRNYQVKCFISNQHIKQPYNNSLCLLRALAAHFHGTIKIETTISKIFFDSLEKLGDDPKQFRGVSMDNLPIVEHVVGKNIFIYDIDIEAHDSVGELTWRRMNTHKKTVKYSETTTLFLSIISTTSPMSNL